MSDVAVPNTLYPSDNALLLAGYTAAQDTDAGRLVFLNASNQWELTDASDDTHGAAANATVGMAVNLANTNQPLTVVLYDELLTVGSGVVKGTIYVASTNSGNIMPDADLANADYRIVVATAISNGALVLKPTPTGNIGG